MACDQLGPTAGALSCQHLSIVTRSYRIHVRPRNHHQFPDFQIQFTVQDNPGRKCTEHSGVQKGLLALQSCIAPRTSKTYTWANLGDNSNLNAPTKKCQVLVGNFEQLHPHTKMLLVLTKKLSFVKIDISERFAEMYT